jgi:hypothetical protein
MLKTFLLIVLWSLSSLHISAQKHQLSLAGTYAPLIVLADNPKYYQSIGSTFGYEYKIGPHATIGVGAHFNRFLEESQFASNFDVTSTTFVLYTIERQQFAVQNALRYYFNKAYNKFYLGGFASYNYLKITTNNYPNTTNFDKKKRDPEDETSIGLGLLYGYNYALNSSWNLSLFGSTESTTPDIFLENLGLRLQFGLSLQLRL